MESDKRRGNLLSVRTAHIVSLPARAAGGVAILTSNLVAGAALIWLISGRAATYVDGTNVVFLLLFVQWQVLGLTIVKFGIDQVIFATISSNPTIRFSLSSTFVTHIAPAAIVYSLISGYVLGLTAGVVILASLILDCFSIARSSELNALGRFFTTAVGTLVNYPLFVLLVLYFAFNNHLGTNAILSSFLFASIVRAIWLEYRTSSRMVAAHIVCKANFQMALQQAQNYVLFRGDQLLIALVVYGFATGFVAQDELQAYLFMAKFPELVSSGVVVLGTIAFPVLHLLPDRRIHRDAGLPRAFIYMSSAGFALAILFGASAYTLIYSGTIPATLAIPFVLHALLIFPVNMITYSMLRSGHLSTLLHNLQYSIATGFSVLVVLALVDTPKMGLLYLVPSQLGAFTVLGLFRRWGSARRLYEPENAMDR
jgi:hypothetical protein